MEAYTIYTMREVHVRPEVAYSAPKIEVEVVGRPAICGYEDWTFTKQLLKLHSLYPRL